MNKTRKLIATGLIAGTMSAGAAGIVLGAGAASAGGLSDRPCNKSYYYCGGKPKPNPWVPPIQGPGIPRR